MKIVFLHNDFRAYWKGRLYYLHNYFKSYQIEITVIEIFETSAYTFDKAQTKEAWWHCLFSNQQFSKLSDKTVRRALLKRLDEINPDILVAGPVAFTSGAIGLKWTKKRGKKIIIFDDAKHSVYKRSGLVNLVKKKLTKQADAFLVPSEDYIAEYSKWSINKDQLYFGLNCIDNSYYSSRRQRPKFKLKTFICVARLVPIKNLHSLVDCWATVEKVSSEHQLLIIGDGPEYNSLQQQITELNLSQIKLLGARNKKVVAALLAQSEAFILPSYLEGWALVVNEAMAAGLPVLLSDTINSGHTLLSPFMNGLSFSPSDKEELLKCLLWFISADSSQRLLLSLNAINAVEKYSYKYLGDQLLSAIENLRMLAKKPIHPIDKLLVNFWNGKFKTANWDTIK